VFSLIRIKLLWALNELGEDGATARQLSGGLNIPDGSLYPNLNALSEMGYIKCLMVEYEGDTIKSYIITDDGLLEWKKMKRWLIKITKERHQDG
jgi:DNA-binding PadR family transcriptional regulator